MRGGIFIPRYRTWAKSRKLLVEALGDYYDDKNPSLIFKNKNSACIQDKIRMNKLLDEYGIRHPKTYYLFDEIPWNSRKKCVIKHRFGQMGKNIIFTTFDAMDSYYIHNNYYIQDYIPFEKEYRVGVDWNRVLGIREKIGNVKIRNSRTCSYETRHLITLDDFAWKVFKKFDIQLAGIDIGEYKKKYYVIELNSAPTLGPAWARKLKNDLVKLYNALH